MPPSSHELVDSYTQVSVVPFPSISPEKTTCHTLIPYIFHPQCPPTKNNAAKTPPPTSKCSTAKPPSNVTRRTQPSQADYDSDSILDIAVRLCDREGFDPEEELGPQASDLLREVFESFEESGIRIGTWHATAEDRMLRPEIVAQHEILRSGLQITARVPVIETWSGRVR